MTLSSWHRSVSLKTSTSSSGTTDWYPVYRSVPIDCCCNKFDRCPSRNIAAAINLIAAFIAPQALFDLYTQERSADAWTPLVCLRRYSSTLSLADWKMLLDQTTMPCCATHPPSKGILLAAKRHNWSIMRHNVGSRLP